MHRAHDEAAPRLLVLAALLTMGCRDADTTTAPTTGSLAVSVSTAGSVKSFDADGYTLRVDGGSPRSMAINAAMVIFNLAPGPHVVLLDGVASNCSVADNPRSVEVVAGEGPIGRATVSFSVSCASTGGTVQISAQTSGIGTDADGYSIYLLKLAGAGSDFGTVDANGTATLSDVAAGQYAVTLYGVSANCEPAAENPREITVAVGATTSLAIAVACDAPAQIAFVGGDGAAAEIYVATTDGSQEFRLTNNLTADLDPAWSPDGTKIAFTSQRDANQEIYVMNANGTNPVRLTSAPSSDYGPTWSPDGTRIAFVSNRDGNAEIYAMNADGSSPERLTTSGGIDDAPAWSPDGSTIAFRREAGAGSGLYLMDANGGNTRQLASSVNGDQQPSWSPDGTRIAFSRQSTGNVRDIFVVNADGSDALNLSKYFEEAAHPAWAPNGRKIAFNSSSNYYNTTEVVVIGLDGVLYAPVTRRSPSYDPAWRP